MRDNNGWLLRPLSPVCQCFIAVYVHMAKNLYYGSILTQE